MKFSSRNKREWALFYYATIGRGPAQTRKHAFTARASEIGFSRAAAELSYNGLTGLDALHRLISDVRYEMQRDLDRLEAADRAGGFALCSGEQVRLEVAA